MSDLLSQDEIDALLNGISSESNDGDYSSPNAETAEEKPNTNVGIDDGEDLSPQEIDVLGEVGNISMGASATALSEILRNTVTITTPKVEILRWKDLIEMYPKPFVITKVQFTMGLSGTNMLIMKVEDVKVLTNLMMNEDPKQNREITELELSATGEAMNQMVGSSCTSLSSMIAKKIDITPPEASCIDFSGESIQDIEQISGFDGDGRVVKISFRMIVGDLIDSELMQLLPIPFAKELVRLVFKAQGGDFENTMNNETATSVENTVSMPVEKPVIQTPIQQPQMQMPQMPPQMAPQPMYQQPMYQQPMYQQPMQANSEYYQMPAQKEPQMREPINVQPVQFQSLDDAHYANYKENINLIMDVPLQVTVELGRASRMIREILEFGPGSIVELDKLAGEPVDILVNGKNIAKGEVVVIDESFGIRITDIVHPSKRL